MKHQHKVLIGKTRAGKELRIPQTNSNNELLRILFRLCLDDQVDLFCIVEYLALKYKRDKFDGEVQENILFLLNVFLNLTPDPLLDKKLQSLNLSTSTARILLGQKLAIP